MPARKPPPPDEKPQRERFIETARAIGASDDPEVFERIFRGIVKPRPITQTTHSPNSEPQGEG
jgi:hypothetical protein